MALSKIIAEGVDLTDTFAFTGTVTGAGDVLDATTTVPSEGGAVTTNLVQGLVKAFIYTTNKTTYAPTGSFNVTSMTDNGTGRPETNFTNNFNDTNIAGSFDAGYNRVVGNYTSDGGITTSSFAKYILSTSGSNADVASTGVGFGAQYVGDLA